jgi:hypothetical protein
MMGRPFVAALVVSLCLGLLAVLGLLLGSPSEAGRASQVTTALGIDANAAGNSDTSLGQIDPCVSVAAGESFDVDVFVTDVVDLMAWQATLIYDPSVLRVTETNVELFLASGEPGRMINLSDLPPNQDGTYDFAVVAITPGGEGHNGTGLLARAKLEAVATGTSFLTLGHVILGDSSSQAIGDLNGDDMFDGPIADAQVWVGEPCPSSLPTRIPGPSPTVTPEATPPGAATPSPPAATPKPGEPTPATPSAQPSAQAPPSEGDNGGGFPWVVVTGAGIAAIVAALAAALVFRWLLRRAS